MRRNLKISVGFVALLGLALVVPESYLAATTLKPVKVDAKCPKQEDGKFSISVDPFEVVVLPGEGVEWKLYSDDEKNEEIKVSAKNPEDWLYSVTSVEGKKEVVMTEMVSTTPDKVYEYEITIYCGEREPVVLDPRIKVGGG